MTSSTSDLSIEALALPSEDPAELRRLSNEWMAAYPGSDPVEQGFIDQALTALIEKRRSARVRATVRSAWVRTAVECFNREEEDYVAQCLQIFQTNCEHAMRCLTRRASGCRWAIAQWNILRDMLIQHQTLHGEHRINIVQLLGHNACLDKLFLSEAAFRTWLDCIVANPNPKQRDINQILDPMCVPISLRERDEVLWPGNASESRARLQTTIDGELARLKALEATLRVQYQEPARAEAQDQALAIATKQTLPLLRAERTFEQSYACAVNALLKLRKQRAMSTSRVPAATASASAFPLVRELDETVPILGSNVAAPAASASATESAPASPDGNQPVVGQSEHRTIAFDRGFGRGGRGLGLRKIKRTRPAGRRRHPLRPRSPNRNPTP